MKKGNLLISVYNISGQRRSAENSLELCLLLYNTAIFSAICMLLFKNVAASQSSREIPFVVRQVLDNKNTISALYFGWSCLWELQTLTGTDRTE